MSKTTRFSIHNARVRRAIKSIESVIIDFLISNDGEVSIASIEDHTGLKRADLKITAEILWYMASNGVIAIVGETVTGDVAKLKEVRAKAKTILPENHNKLWDDASIIILCEMHMEGKSKLEIARKLGRSENAINEAMTRLRLAYRLIPIIEKYSIVREFCETTSGPHADDSHNAKAHDGMYTK